MNEYSSSFCYTYRSLYEQCMEKIQYIRRDIREFGDFDIFDEQINAFQNFIEKLQEIPKEEFEQPRHAEHTFQKERVRRDLAEVMHKVRIRMYLAFSNNSDEYNRMGNMRLMNMSDEDLVKKAELLEQIILDYKKALFDNGLTEDVVERLKDMRRELKLVKENSYRWVLEKNRESYMRRLHANNTFELLKKYSMIGRAIWQSADEMKYDEYRLTPVEEPAMAG